MNRLNGVIEAFNGNLLQGWVVPEGFECDAADIEVVLIFDDKLVGCAQPTTFRKEFGRICAYSVTSEKAIDATAYFGGRVKLIARYGEIETELLATRAARARLVVRLIETYLTDIDLPDIEQLAGTLSRLPAAQRSAFAPLQENRDRLDIQVALKAIRPADAPLKEISLVPVEVGYVSPDGSAVIGRQGYGFLVQGSNQLLRQFSLPKKDVSIQPLVESWTTLIMRREATVVAEGPQFLQLIIPEKLSLYPERFPGKITAPSALLQSIEEQVIDSPTYLSGYQALLPLKSNIEIFPRLDTHLTVPAAYRIFSLCLDRLGLGCPFPLDLSVETELVGDISDRFFGVPLTETYLAPAPAFVATYTGALELVERIDDGIHHIGTRYAWRNELAPIDLKVVAFGNSFFERGGTARSITWWFQRAFREFHFLWSPELNMDYVRMIKPDIVVCQTIERFLGRLPDDKF